MSLSKLSLIFLLLLSYVKINCQEVFFGHQSGISTLYLKGLGQKYSDANAAGISAYFKNGICASAGYMNDGNKTSPLIGLSYFINNKSTEFPTANFGISYAPVQKLVQLNFEGIKTLFMNSNFPSSISGGFSVNMELAERDDSFLDIIPVLGLNYTQAFFAKKIIYPYAGISAAYATLGSEYMFSAMVGLNFKLGKIQN